MTFKLHHLPIIIALCSGLLSHNRMIAASITGKWSGPNATYRSDTPLVTYAPNTGISTNLLTPTDDAAGGTGQLASGFATANITTAADALSANSGDATTSTPTENPATSDKVSKSSTITTAMALKVAPADVTTQLCQVMPGLCLDIATPTSTATTKKAGPPTTPKPAVGVPKLAPKVP